MGTWKMNENKEKCVLSWQIVLPVKYALRQRKKYNGR